MNTIANQATLIFFTCLLIVLIYMLAPILTPFMLGALLAYLIDPIVKTLERCHLPHLLSVLIVFLVFFCSLALLLIFLYPHVVNQIDLMISLIPQALEWTQNVGMPWLLQHVNISSLKSSFPATLSKTGWLLSTFVHSSIAAIRSLVSIILTPVVTFYLLRDWDKIIQNIKNLLPASAAPSLIQLASDCDDVLSAFVRGQLIVMLCLACIYSLGLSLTGLKLGLMIGLIGGALSIVPYLGSTFVLVASMIAAFMQFGFNESMLYVLLVFVVGQATEGYILTPYLIGERIGLHPVAVIFSIMAGGTLFGFFGVLLALPVAAVLVATAKFYRHRPT